MELSNEFPDISECKKNVILSVLFNVSVINGLYFEQLWYVDHHNVLICVKQSKKSQVPKVIITYGRMMNAKKKERKLQYHCTGYWQIM